MKRALKVYHSRKVTGLTRCRLLILFLIAVYAEAQAQSGAWTRKKDMPTGRAVISACVVNDTIYVIGGYDPNGVNYAANEAYHPPTDTWKVKKPLPKGRAFVSTAAVNGIIYAIGGGYPDTTSEVLAYDPMTDTGWTPRAPLRLPRFGASAAVIDGIIYNVAGNHVDSDCEAYNPTANTWTKKADIPNTAGGVMVTPLNGLLYAFGGGFSSPFSTVNSYNPSTDQWTTRMSMPTPRATSQVCAVDGKIYVLGGYSAIQGEVLADVEVYDPATDSWVKKPDMPFKLTMFGAAVVNGKIYVIGGTSDWGWAHGNQVWEYDPSFHTDIAAGSVSGLWTVDKSPYQINGDITIPNDSTLTIQPGVEVVFMGHYKFNVQGRLLAVGTQKDSIRFTAEDTQTGWHGIRFVGTANTNDTSKIVYCTLRNGKAVTGSGFDKCGGAMFISQFDKVLVSNCLFDSNTQSGEEIAPVITGGPAIYIDTASPIITNSTFSHNSGSKGSAILCHSSPKAIISNNTLFGNSGGWVGCIVTLEIGSPTVSGNIIFENYAGAAGGGISVEFGASPRIENNIITNNFAPNGGGIFCNQNTQAVLLNNTISNNIANIGSGYGGGILCMANSDPILINNILYGNRAAYGSQVALYDLDSDPHFLYCDIQGGKEGFDGAVVNYAGRYENNIDADPMIIRAASGDYRLSDSSPCIGVGTDSVEIAGVWYHVPAFCIGGNPRPSPVGSMPDIGACENLLGSPLVGVDHESRKPTQFVLHQNYPNPFNPTTTIKYELSKSSDVRLSVFDMLGREVSVLVNEKRNAGYHEVRFDASGLSSGVYFYRLQAGTYVETRRLLLLR